MIPRVIEAQHLRDYVIRLRFQDGAEGEVNLEPQLYGEVFEPLKAPEYFRRFRVDPDLQTLTWPNGADFAPEFLYEKALIPAKKITEANAGGQASCQGERTGPPGFAAHSRATIRKCFMRSPVPVGGGHRRLAPVADLCVGRSNREDPYEHLERAN